jgi:hypothetical protein
MSNSSIPMPLPSNNQYSVTPLPFITPVAQPNDTPYTTPDGHIFHSSHPTTFIFTNRFLSFPFIKLHITITHTSGRVPQAILTFQTFQDSAHKRIAAKELIFHPITTPSFFPPQYEPLTTVLPHNFPTVFDLVRAHQKLLYVSLVKIDHHDAYKLNALPIAADLRSFDKLSEGVHIVWEKKGKFQIVAVKRIYQNIVVFIARESRTDYSIEIWAPQEWA